jgi:hypothetical protein
MPALRLILQIMSPEPFADSPLEGNGFELPVPQPDSRSQSVSDFARLSAGGSRIRTVTTHGSNCLKLDNPARIDRYATEAASVTSV